MAEKSLPDDPKRRKRKLEKRLEELETLVRRPEVVERIKIKLVPMETPSENSEAK